MPSTTARLPFHSLAAPAVAALSSLNTAVSASGLEPVLIDLVYLRVSQLNGCAYCVDMHWRDLLKVGDDAQRLNSLSTWRETAFFTPREEAALNWAERLTTLPNHNPPAHPCDADFDALRPHFNDAEIVNLSFTIAAINAWNRIGVGMHLPVVKRAVSR